MPSLDQIPTLIAAVGALGIAAFGIVDAFGKSLFVFDLKLPGGRRKAIGLPFVGFQKVRAVVRDVGPALRVTYGDGYDEIIRQQYRSGRGAGQAPETIRQGVRLGLPLLSPTSAADVVASMWGLPREDALNLARALVAEKRPGAKSAAKDVADAQKMAGRWATAFDTRVQAAFDLAEEIYQARAQFWAGAVAVGLSLAYHGATAGSSRSDPAGWIVALIVGLAAVPLAPIAKDLSSKLSDAVGALKQINSKAR